VRREHRRQPNRVKYEPCAELFGDGRSSAGNLDQAEKWAEETDLGLYCGLHPDGRRLMRGWFREAWNRRDCDAEDSFEPFIFVWIAFNGWAACVTGRDSDRQWRSALTLNRTVREDFARLAAEVESPVATHAAEFARFWPVFKVQDLRSRGIRTHDTGDRQQIVERYMREGAEQFQPGCWARHGDEAQEVPVDWPHTLAALYRVRCNLFHGEKARHSEMDRAIVSGAFRVLVHFLSDAGYLTR
jgi:hypothetical protein